VDRFSRLSNWRCEGGGDAADLFETGAGVGVVTPFPSVSPAKRNVRLLHVLHTTGMKSSDMHKRCILAADGGMA
jgi:hypothetical protein